MVPIEQLGPTLPATHDVQTVGVEHVMQPLGQMAATHESGFTATPLGDIRILQLDPRQPALHTHWFGAEHPPPTVLHPDLHTAVKQYDDLMADGCAETDESRSGRRTSPGRNRRCCMRCTRR